jgi:hypothetical protein
MNKPVINRGFIAFWPEWAAPKGCLLNKLLNVFRPMIVAPIEQLCIHRIYHEINYDEHRQTYNDTKPTYGA